MSLLLLLFAGAYGIGTVSVLGGTGHLVVILAMLLVMAGSAIALVRSQASGLRARQGPEVWPLMAPYTVLSVAIFASNNYGIFASALQSLIRMQSVVALTTLAVLLARKPGSKNSAVGLAQCAFLLIGAFGLMRGILLGNSVLLAVGDSVRFLLTAMALSYGAQFGDPYRLLSKVAKWIIAGLAVGIAIHIVILLLIGYRRLGGEILTPLVFGLAVAVKGRGRERGKAVLVLGLVVLAVALSASRGAALLLAGALVCFLLRSPLRQLLPTRQDSRSGGAHRLILTLLVTFSLLAPALWTSPGRKVRDTGVARMREALNPASDQTLVERGTEVESVRAARQFGTGSDRVFGFGSGAQLSMGQAGLLSFRADQGHSIHNTYYSVLFRHGVLGLSVIAFVLSIGARAAVRGLRDDTIFPIGIWYLLSIAAATSAFGIIGDLQWGLFTGSLLACGGHRRSSSKVLPDAAVAS